ncbi:MAG: hypothetical protein HYR56_15385 [Acidobacteria bacterium]|nr:hypothetical protein [Acidobacteriota bacterium]
MKLSLYFGRPVLFFGVPSFCIFASLFAAYSSPPNKANNQVNVAQEEKPLRLVSAVPSLQLDSNSNLSKNENNGEGSLSVKLKNTSSKKVTAYAIRFSDGVIRETDLTIADMEIPAGGVKIDKIGRPDPDKVTIISAILDDSSCEGDGEVCTRIMSQRAGMKSQMLRLNRILQVAINKPNIRELDMLKDLIQQVESLSPETNKNEGEAEGETAAVGRVLFFLRTLEGWEKSRTEGRYEESVSQLRQAGELMGITNSKGGVAKIIAMHNSLVAKY